MASPVKYLFHFLLIVFLFSIQHICCADEITGRVIAISDGDTLTLVDDMFVQHKIRLAGIDAPEKRQSFGQRAKQSLAMMTYLKTVKVKFAKRDRYGRILGQVLIDENDINLAQVQAGMAWVYTQYLNGIDLRTQALLIEAEDSARAASLGLWRDSQPLPPWIFRRLSKS